MIFGNKRRVVGLAIAALLTFTAEFETLAASPRSEAQAVQPITYETEGALLSAEMEEISKLAEVASDLVEWQGRALPKTNKKAYIYGSKSTNYAVGEIYKNTVLEIVKEGKTWTKVKSGSVKGYVKTKKLYAELDAAERADVVCANGTTKAKKIENKSIEKMMAALIYCEAGNQPYKGKVGVGAVVMNRVASKRFPNNIRSVIYQKGQFTPAMTGKLDRIMQSGKIPSSCYKAARAALSGETTVGNALFFNTGHGRFKLGDHYFS